MFQITCFLVAFLSNWFKIWFWVEFVERSFFAAFLRNFTPEIKTIFLIRVSRSRTLGRYKCTGIVGWSVSYYYESILMIEF